jgi:hypothetical protein
VRHVHAFGAGAPAAGRHGARARRLALAGGVHFVSSARAAEPAGRLVYQLAPGAESCPDEAALRRAVAARLGADPFADAARPTYSVTIGFEGEKLVGRVVLVDVSGVAKGVRELASESGCAELVEGLSLALSLAINPELATSGTNAVVAPEPPNEPSPAPSPVVETPPSPDPLPPVPEPGPLPRPTFTWGIGATGYGSVGTAPEVAFGAGALLRLRRGDLSLSLESRFEPSAGSLQSNGANVETRLVAGVLAPCWHFPAAFVQACALGLLGSMRAEASNLPGAQPDDGIYAAAGARAAVEMLELPYVRLQIRLDLLARLVPIRVTRNEGSQTLWEAPPVSGALGLGALYEFP